MMSVLNPARYRSMMIAIAGLLFAGACSSGGPEWAARNKRVIDEHKVTGRTRALPNVSVPNVLAPGVPVENATLPTATIAPGVVARLGWGRGALLEQLEMQAAATYPRRRWLKSSS
jgi:hypothetical protein